MKELLKFARAEGELKISDDGLFETLDDFDEEDSYEICFPDANKYICNWPEDFQDNEDEESEDDDLIFRDEECDDAETYYRTAEDYYYGKNGKNKDDEAAAQWYLKAAEQGHVESYYCLGSMLKEICELEDAIGCFQEAAELGHAAAQYELGVAYSLGLGIEQNNEESMKWYRKAAEQGHEEAIDFLEELGERVPAK
jgi:TPR repeat protein